MCVCACVYAMHIIVLCVYARLSKMNTSVFPPPLPARLPLLSLSLLPAWYSPDTWASSCHGRHASPNSACTAAFLSCPSAKPSVAAACVFVCAAAAAVSWCNNLA